MIRNRPVIAIGMDAMDGSLVEELVRKGRMPNLAALRSRGAYGELRSRPKAFLSMVWPTFYTGQSLGSHGWYFNKLWSPKEQRLRYVDPSWLPIRPFWGDLSDTSRIALLDVPFSTQPEREFQGLFLNGWQAHDDFGKLSFPSGLHQTYRKRFGRPAMGPELFGPQDHKTLRHQWTEAERSLEQFARIVVDTLAEPRDLVVAVFGGAHRGTHYLWSVEEADTSGADAEEVGQLAGARERVYEAADRALGTVLEAARQDALVLVFALHGMGRNRGWAERFPEILRHLHARGREGGAKQGLAVRMKQRLPWRWVRQVTTRLPSTINHALVPLWSRKMLDWPSTRYFALPLDLNGYVRLNIRGREAQGNVEPGRGVEELIAELTQDLLSLQDLRTGEPIVSRVVRVEELVGDDAPRRDVLPDLTAEWTDTYAHGSHGVRSRYGEVRWAATDLLPSGRSGNHTTSGWFVAAGSGVAVGPVEEPVDSLDLVPTLLTWMGRPIADRLEGSPVDRLLVTGET